MSFSEVTAKIRAAALRAGRDPSGVHLLAVSKHQPDDAVAVLVAAGQRDFGESYAQALRDRARGFADVPVEPPIRWHAIGPLQRNKVKYVAAFADVFHALDDEAIGRALGERREGLPLRCLIEVNLAGEATKHGVSPEAVEDLLLRLQQVSGIVVVGLMAMPPLTDDQEASRPHFQRLAALAGRLGLSDLSMGTSSDYEVAVEEGATWVRVGTALFGAREA